MKRRPFGKAGVHLPIIGQGTWNLAEHARGRSDAIAALRHGVALGMTHIDTAEMYGSGEVERIVGEAISGISRDEIFLVSKVLPSNASYDGTIAAAHRSLARLKTAYLDAYLLHWQGGYPIEETMRAMRDLIEAGTIRFAGVSNCDLEAMESARRALSPYPLICNQVLYHIHERTIEHHLLPYAHSNEIAIVGYAPFGREGIATTLADRALTEIASTHHCSPRSILLAFLTRKSNLFAIPKASTNVHVDENAAAGSIELEASEIAAIELAFPVGEAGELATL